VDDDRAVSDAVEAIPEPGRTNFLRRAGVLLAVVSFVGIWGYVLYLSVFVGRSEPLDHLDDEDWVESAEATCAPVAARLDRLPFAIEMETLDERADVLDLATTDLEAMVRSLRGLVAPSDPAEARAVGRWLDDWEEYNRNRRAYADRFRAGLDEPFRVTDRSGYQIDVLLDDFAAKANDMPSCAPPDDVG
jgi:hypothetical protein